MKNPKEQATLRKTFPCKNYILVSHTVYPYPARITLMQLSKFKPGQRAQIVMSCVASWLANNLKLQPHTDHQKTFLNKIVRFV